MQISCSKLSFVRQPRRIFLPRRARLYCRYIVGVFIVYTFLNRFLCHVFFFIFRGIATFIIPSQWCFHESNLRSFCVIFVYCDREWSSLSFFENLCFDCITQIFSPLAIMPYNSWAWRNRYWCSFPFLFCWIPTSFFCLFYSLINFSIFMLSKLHFYASGVRALVMSQMTTQAFLNSNNLILKVWIEFRKFQEIEAKDFKFVSNVKFFEKTSFEKLVKTFKAFPCFENFPRPF